MPGDSETTAAGWGILQVAVRRSGECTLVVRLEGELDVYSAGDLHNRLRETETGCTDVVIDLSRLSFMDCAGLREIVEAGKRARSRGGRLSLIDGPPAVRRLFTLTGLEGSFDFRPLAEYRT